MKGSSIAKRFCDRFHVSKNKEALMLKMQDHAISREKVGDDYLYTMSDLSKLLDRVIVGEWQVFDGRTLDITEEIAILALKLHPKIAVRMALTTRQAVIYGFVVSVRGVSTADISAKSGIDINAIRRALDSLYEKSYVSRKMKGVSKDGGHQYIYSQKLNCKKF